MMVRLVRDPSQSLRRRDGSGPQHQVLGDNTGMARRRLDITRGQPSRHANFLTSLKDGLLVTIWNLVFLSIDGDVEG